jgi:ribosomal protein S18 acetylase RimI-like enzyme
MPALEQITQSNALTFKAVRLRALQDSPSAFGSTYAKESELSDADWLKRAADWSSDRSVGYLALDQEMPCGIVAAFLNEQDWLRAHLVSMWVAPTHRRVGIGRTLIGAVQTWAMMRGARVLQLAVTSSNRTAIEFYQQNGFSMTGNTEPYPNDPTLFEYEMSQPVPANECR